jgi:hypothetical protein
MWGIVDVNTWRLGIKILNKVMAKVWNHLERLNLTKLISQKSHGYVLIWVNETASPTLKHIETIYSGAIKISEVV